MTRLFLSSVLKADIQFSDYKFVATNAMFFAWREENNKSTFVDSKDGTEDFTSTEVKLTSTKRPLFSLLAEALFHNFH